jgi:restriction system protein
MPIPPFNDFFKPFLKAIANGERYSLKDVRIILIESLNISESDLEIKLGSKRQPRFHNRVSWAKTYLKKAKLIEHTDKSLFKITKRGLELLDRNVTHINSKFLKDEYPEFNSFQQIDS